MAQSIQVEDRFKLMAGNGADKTTVVIIPLLLTLVTSSALDLTPQTLMYNASINTAQQQVRRWQAAHEHGHLLFNAPAAAHSARPGGIPATNQVNNQSTTHRHSSVQTHIWQLAQRATSGARRTGRELSRVQQSNTPEAVQRCTLGVGTPGDYIARLQGVHEGHEVES